MPQHLYIAIISGKIKYGGEIASTAAAILKNLWEKEGKELNNWMIHYQPFYVPTSTQFRCRFELSEVGISRGLKISDSTHLFMMNPKTIQVWFALDLEGQDDAHKMIDKYGKPENDFYTDTINKSVLKIKSKVKIPKELELAAWITEFEKLLLPWHEYFKKLFYESS